MSSHEAGVSDLEEQGSGSDFDDARCNFGFSNREATFNARTVNISPLQTRPRQYGFAASETSTARNFVSFVLIMVPQITTAPLNRADGSAKYEDGLFSVLAAVNGPVEVSRRDELPEEAAIEVNIRPGSGTGGPRERWLESVVHSVLRSVLLVHLFPRTLVQVTLQVTKEPGVVFRKGRGDVAVLPTLVNAAFLALVDGGLPLDTTMNAVLVARSAKGDSVGQPGVKELVGCESVHAMAFNALGDLLMAESTGGFEAVDFGVVAEIAQKQCLAAVETAGEDDAMANSGAEAEPWLRQALEEKVRDANAWREET